MKLTVLISFILFLFYISSSAQPLPKKVAAVKSGGTIKIDGSLDEPEWRTAPAATDFIDIRPVPGRHEGAKQKTEIRFLYDNTAIYIGARMYETTPDSIARELVARDNVGNSDFIGVIFDTYYDKINASGFFVTAAGVQFDAKYSLGGNEDPAWNAVWLSEVKIDKQGWTAEFKIPYSALRFAKHDVQTWGLNITRKRQKAQEQLFWNFVDPKVNGFINQEGVLSEIKDIKPPLRLSFSPYISSYVNNYPYNQPGLKNTTSSFNGGMDVKYGINQSFTLDMTLVPDFGQVQSDNTVLNLSPFEVKYNENRQFFTEGTELFNKGNLFYSRRVGANPNFIRDVSTELKSNETVLKNPVESKLINATKVSGRTAKGLGIGVFNAVTKAMDAVVEDTLTHYKSNLQAQPLTNYNILVLDQSLKHNSSVTLINTNVLRQGSAYDANVTGFLFNLNNKTNKYNINGGAKLSHLQGGGMEPSNGLNYTLQAGKVSGNFTFNVISNLTDEKYDPNDLGILLNNNFFDNTFNAFYGVYKPGKWYNEIQSGFQAIYSQRYKPRAYQSFGLYGWFWTRFKNFWSAEVDVDWQPQQNDFYEPRVAGRVFHASETKGIGGSVNTNKSKKISGGMFGYYRWVDRFDAHGYDFETWGNFQINNKFSVGMDVMTQPRLDYSGYVRQDETTGNIIFSRRDRQTITNTLNSKYTFSNKMGITLRVRHYWSNLYNKDFYTLLNDGELMPNPAYIKQDDDRNFNSFNIDMIYSWVFSPGSELSIAWKNASLINENLYRDNYFRNVNEVIESPQNNNFSVKLLYYIDYLSLKGKKQSKTN
ncbi:hypothetical protein GS399_02625 [Pedobacter sp. HMF7647]|uniref:DUF5916 domain-containing protein n=1 Tax=Hufsiella arboris TaxID=2695275 RepID=A0A7K1Y5Y2_9SPHI|nr:DUF5916 domain-containing protein [Hufsiella arboris]MXV49850.1 hypothetical protein [Hufsiella arboris]